MSRVIKSAIWQTEPKIVEIPPLPKRKAPIPELKDAEREVLMASLAEREKKVEQMLRETETACEVMKQKAQDQQQQILAKAQEEAAALAAAQNSSSITGKLYGVSGLNPYSGGWSNCTAGAWEAVYENLGVSLPNFGDAGGWLYSASSDGYATGSSPAVGSVAVYSHHVAYVDAVSADGSAVHIIEGNYAGHYNERWVSASGDGFQANIGYIYVK